MQIILKYFTKLHPTQINQFIALDELYCYWNSKINIISRQDIDSIYLHHILHSLSIAKIIDFKPGTSILDVGTGGGFPGIPLAILFPEAKFYLVDSIKKKINVTESIIESLQLKNCFSFCMRAEKITDKYHFIISRAVTQIPKFLLWVTNKLKEDSFNDLKNGILYLKGGDFQNELDKIRYNYKLFNIKDFFSESFFETKKIIYIFR